MIRLHFLSFAVQAAFMSLTQFGRVAFLPPRRRRRPEAKEVTRNPLSIRSPFAADINRWGRRQAKCQSIIVCEKQRSHFRDNYFFVFKKPPYTKKATSSISNLIWHLIKKKNRSSFQSAHLSGVFSSPTAICFEIFGEVNLTFTSHLKRNHARGKRLKEKKTNIGLQSQFPKLANPNKGSSSGVYASP